jgi:hypothetical protein
MFSLNIHCLPEYEIIFRKRAFDVHCQIREDGSITHPKPYQQ